MKISPNGGAAIIVGPAFPFCQSEPIWAAAKRPCTHAHGRSESHARRRRRPAAVRGCDPGGAAVRRQLDADRSRPPPAAPCGRPVRRLRQ
eukprot:6836173-Prymnesium_polylepis.1